jgi:eukaryotic-like serine/threonine-protein kinase
MTYPDAQDYIQAVQHPARVFRRPELRKAEFDLHPLWGIPVPASGNAAVVFKATVAGSATALRFFIREDASTHERYTALGRHFVERRIEDCVAMADWVDDAIRLNDATWPMVRMTWVDGRTLDAYVGHLAGSGNVAALAVLADNWRTLVRRLQAAEFAHGDLQHGNVLVDTNSALRLVDFDGSWIAALSGGPAPNETGHPNYQRTGRQWGRWMDSFPSLVIYTALLTLSRRPDAWERLHTGENMLFSAADFAPPFDTPAWTTIAGIGDLEVQHAAQRLREACTPGWSAADTLESLLAGSPVIDLRRPVSPDSPDYAGVSAATLNESWWQRTGALPSGAPAVAATGAAMPPPPPKDRPLETSSEALVHRPGTSSTSTDGRPAWFTPGSGASTPWPDGPRAASTPSRPRSGRSNADRPFGEFLFLLLCVFGLTFVLVGVLVAAGGGAALPAATLSGIIVVAIASPRLRRKP